MPLPIKLIFEKCCGATILSSVKSFCVLTHMNNFVHGFAWPYTEIRHQSAFFTRLPDIVSQGAHQLLGRLHTLFFRPSGEH